MDVKLKLLLSVVALGFLLGVGGVASYAAFAESDPSQQMVNYLESDPGDSGILEPASHKVLPTQDHDECYDGKKPNDPSDFCYQTIGPWNSTTSTDEEVRELVSIEQMVAIGATTAEIQRYYPRYRP